MRILYVTNMYPNKNCPNYGIFVKEQVDWIRKKHICDVFFIDGKKSKWNYFFAVSGLIKKMKNEKYNIIHVHHTYCIPPVKVAQKVLGLKNPVILTLHEGEAMYSKEINFVSDFWSFLRYSLGLKRYLLKKVDYVITVNVELLKKILLGNEHNIKFSEIPCGVDLEKFKPMDKFQCRQRLNLPLDRKIVFFPANPKRVEKNFVLLKESLKIINLRDIYLITGGNINFDLMPLFYNASDVVVLTSYYEASPTVIKEALACDRPVVSTYCGDVKKLLIGVSGCYIADFTPEDLAEKIKYAIKNERSEGRKRVIELGLGMEQTTNKILKIYKEVFQNESGRNS